MKRRHFIALSLLALIVGALGLRSWDLAVDRIQTHVASGIRNWGGIDIASVEKANIALLPLPRIKLQRVVFTGDDDRVSGRAREVVARLRLLPLVWGRLGFDRIDLRAPEIELKLSSEAEAPRDWVQGVIDSLGRVSRDARIVVTAGTLFIRRGELVGTVVRDVNVVLNERGPEDPIALNGSVNWRGAVTEVSAVWPLAAGRAPASMSARSPLAMAEIQGERTGAGEPVFQGRLRFETSSLPEAVAWVGNPPRLAGALGKVSLAAEVRMSPRETALSQIKLSLDGETLEGALTLAAGEERWGLTGTLAGTSLDIGRLYERLEGAAGGQSPAGETPLDFESWTSHDIDLRVSVDAARAGPARLGGVATQLLVKKGRFEAALLRADAYGGAIRGRLLAAPAHAGVDVKLQAGLDRISLGQAASAFPALARISGSAGAQIALEGAGRNAEELRQAIAGKVSVTLRQGEIAGFGFADLMRRGDRNPLTVLRDWRQGKSAYDSATLNALVQNGSVFVQEAVMTAPNWRLMLAGTGSLVTRRLELEGALSGATGTPRLPMTLRGPIADPTMAIDGAALLREPASLTTPTR